MARIKLTRLSHGGGCACKLSSEELERALRGFDQTDSPASPPGLLIGLASRDDAAAFIPEQGDCLVFTTDFITPVVDEPYDWGQIATANAFSDVYAMAATPFLALNILAWPRELDFAMLDEVLGGGAAKARQATCTIVGGHSIDDREPKYGLAVLGRTSEEELASSASGKPGYELLLTKPLGVGIVATALKNDLASKAIVSTATRLMTTLNEDASRVARAHSVRTITDITGFGLVGHLHELTWASGLAAELFAESIPAINGVHELLEQGMAPSGTKRNHRIAENWTDWGILSQNDQLVLADAQTSGGLLLGVPSENAEAVEAALAEAGTPTSRRVGRLVEGKRGEITIRGRSLTTYLAEE